jgi:hypothetical protein
LKIIGTEKINALITNTEDLEYILSANSIKLKYELFVTLKSYVFFDRLLSQSNLWDNTKNLATNIANVFSTVKFIAFYTDTISPLIENKSLSPTQVYFQLTQIQSGIFDPYIQYCRKHIVEQTIQNETMVILPAAKAAAHKFMSIAPANDTTLIYRSTFNPLYMPARQITTTETLEGLLAILKIKKTPAELIDFLTKELAPLININPEQPKALISYIESRLNQFDKAPVSRINSSYSSSY